MSLSYGIAHAAWMPERKASLDRLVAQLPEGALVSKSLVREHASTWATRLWAWAAEQTGHVVLLNDDVIVPEGFDATLRRVVEAVPDKVIALHTTAPIAASIADAGGQWLRSYWLTGPGYILPPGAAAALLKFAAAFPSLTRAMNEDGVIMHWAWLNQTPIWHTVPALVAHDTGVASSLGYDAHSMRAAAVDWHTHGLPLDWTPTGQPPLVECPWMPRAELAAQVRGLMGHGAQLCSMCLKERGMVHGEAGGAICRECLGKSIHAVLGAMQ